MERWMKDCMRFLLIASFLLSIGATLFTQCDARTNSKQHLVKDSRLQIVNRLNAFSSLDPYYYVGSPLLSPSYDNIMSSPSSSPQSDPSFCVNPPPLPPTTITSPPPPIILPSLASPPPPPPSSPLPPPPPSPIYSFPPIFNPYPPNSTPTPPTSNSCPTTYGPSPPSPTTNTPIIAPSPPKSRTPNPPKYVPSPPIYDFLPSPPQFMPGPAIMYPPPSVPPPSSSSGSNRGLWCVAKPTVPDQIIQEAMDYACGSSADCDPIQPNGSCYEPNTMIAHASFAFNSYWQRTKVVGGKCDFGGTAMLITRDPSFDGCHFQHA